MSHAAILQVLVVSLAGGFMLTLCFWLWAFTPTADAIRTWLEPSAREIDVWRFHLQQLVRTPNYFLFFVMATALCIASQALIIAVRGLN